MRVEEIQHFCENTMVSHLGIEFLELTKEKLVARMPVDARTKQPMGYLHGGASLALIETVGSGLSAATTDLSQFAVFGINVNANHVKAVQKGFVYATAQYIHKGKQTQVVGVNIYNEANELVCEGRITNIITPK